MAQDCTNGLTNQDKWVVSIILALIASLLYSPFWFSIMNAGSASFGIRTSSSAGLPNLAGLLITTIVYFLIIRLILL